jgi:hypothetical protein
MAEQSFFTFREAARPDIGLVSDGFQNLSEIFESDKRTALRNMGLSPEVLDSLYGLSGQLSDREDFRFCSGLEKTLLPALQQLSEIYVYQIPTSLYDSKDYYSPSLPLGGEGSPYVNYPNVIIFNGSIQCEGAQYLTNTIGDTIFSNPVRKLVAVSTSRNSLFNSEGDPVNLGYFKNASYAGSVRVRRRSHVNRIFLPLNSILPRPEIVESPSHSLDMYIDNNSGTSTPLKLLSTKNTPLKVLCRMSTGTIKFTFTDSNSPYFYGFQIQPLQKRPNSPAVDFLPVVSVAQASGSLQYTVNIDITATGYQTIYDLYLYLYVNPVKVKAIEFSGIDIRETQDRKDLGLIGYDNLESFTMVGGSMTILPLWLKTLKNKLRRLDLSKSGDVWKSGVMGWFDYRDPTLLPSTSAPQCTAVSYLTVPRKGIFVNEAGNDWSDALFRKYVLNESGRVANVDYRQFSSMEELVLGDRFKGYSPRLDDVFPNLRVLTWSNRDLSRPFSRFLYGNLPKINNNGSLISYDIYNSGGRGDITQIGTSTDPTNFGHISKYRIVSFNIGTTRSGPSLFESTGYINNPVGEDWSAWRSSSVSISLTRTSVFVNLQNGQWDSLVTLEAPASRGGVKFDLLSSSIKAPKLTTLSLGSSFTEGKVPSLGTDPATETGSLVTLELAACDNLLPVTDNGVDFFLPVTFAPARGPVNQHNLKTLSLGFSSNPYRFRKNDLINLHYLDTIDVRQSNFTGRFPTFPSRYFPDTERKDVSISINLSGFYDISPLSITTSNQYFSRDITRITADNCNPSGGGALLPSFEGVTETPVVSVKLDNSLPSVYRSDWGVQSLRGACVLSRQPSTALTGLSITRKVPASSPDDAVYSLTGPTALNQKVMVYDSVRASETGPELAKVMSVTSTEIIISADIPGTLPSTLYFTRSSIDISNWFRLGYTKLTSFSAENCRLSGTFSIRTNLNLITLINLKQNAISSYATGTFARIFKGSNRRIVVDLTNNALSVSTIRTIVQEIVEIDKLRVYRNCQVRLNGNNLTSADRYSNYTQQDIFPTVITAGRQETISLFRNENFQVYSERQTTNQITGATTFTYTLIGPQTYQVSGSLVSGTYYKTQIKQTQSISEDPLGVSYKNLFGISITFGFTYVTPSTTSSSVNITYTNVTTRNASITELGWQLLPSCPGTVGAGTCWRNQSNQILKLA